MPRGIFITLEGGEGVGKTTQRKLLEERLPGLVPEYTFVFTREPGGTPFADKIRALILSDEAKDADGKTMFGLFAAARAEHLRHIVIPALREGKVVVSDRFATATFAYQAYAMDNPISEEFFGEYYGELDEVPSLTIILDLDPVVAQERVATRSTQDATHFDTRPEAFHQRLREGYQRFAKEYDGSGHSVVLIDASEPPEVVHEKIRACIAERIFR